MSSVEQAWVRVVWHARLNEQPSWYGPLLTLLRSEGAMATQESISSARLDLRDVSVGVYKSGSIDLEAPAEASGRLTAVSATIVKLAKSVGFTPANLNSFSALDSQTVEMRQEQMRQLSRLAGFRDPICWRVGDKMLHAASAVEGAS